MTKILNHTRVASGAPDRWLYLLHGIYGSGRNWATLARRLVDDCPSWGVILVDLRLHGGSLGFAGPHTLASSSADLLALEEHLGLPAAAFLGHSFGGKLALLHVGEHRQGPTQVWVVDSTLRVGAPSGSPWGVIGIVRSLPPTFGSREELTEEMVRHGYAAAVGQWLGMNLEREGDRFRWRLDWEGVEEMLRDYFATDVWPIVEAPPAGTEIHIVKALSSEALDSATVERIRAAGARNGAVQLHEVAGGHWVNVDNPDAVLGLLEEFLPGS